MKFSLLVLLLSFVLTSCYEDSEECETWGIRREYVNEGLQYMQAHRPGDTLRMKVYRRTPADSGQYSYSYLGQIQLAATDSFEEQFFRKGESPFSYENDCRSQYYEVHQMLRFTGDSVLTMRLAPDRYIATLTTYFAGKTFPVTHWGFRVLEGEYFKVAMEVNGLIYNDVHLIRGYKTAGSAYHADSTCMFYNASHGILRFVINDEYVFERM